MLKIYICIASVTLFISCHQEEKSISIYDILPISEYETVCDSLDSTFYDLQIEIGKLEKQYFPELSGLCRSSKKDLFWGINDSGNLPYIYLINSKGELISRFLLDIELNDWEDIAYGDGKIYISDTGNNKLERKSLGIIEIIERTLLEKLDSIGNSDSFDDIILDKSEFTYHNIKTPEKLFDIEAIFFNTHDSNIYLITKREESNIVFKLQLRSEKSDVETDIIPVIKIPYFFITAADMSSDGKRLLMKSYHYIYMWENNSKKKISDLILEEPYCIPYTPEPQGEAIAFSNDSYDFVTGSEIKNGYGYSSIYFFKSKK